MKIRKHKKSVIEKSRTWSTSPTIVHSNTKRRVACPECGHTMAWTLVFFYNHLKFRHYKADTEIQALWEVASTSKKAA